MPRPVPRRLFAVGIHRRWTTFIAITLGTVVVAPFFILLFDRREPIELGEAMIEPSGSVNSGQEVTITWSAVERRAGCDGEFERRVIDSTGRIFPYRREPTVYRLTYNAKAQIFTRQFRLPNGLAPGRAIITTVGTRWCNSVQKYLWPIPFQGPIIQATIK